MPWGLRGLWAISQEIAQGVPIPQGVLEGLRGTPEGVLFLHMPGALKKVTGKRHYHTESIVPVLTGFRVSQPDTCDVEHTFMKHRKLIKEQSRHAGNSIEEMRLKIVVDRRKDEDQEVVALARRIWVTEFGNARDHSTTIKMTKGLKRKDQGGYVEGVPAASEADWIRKRRRAVGDALVASAKKKSPSTDTKYWRGGWSEGHKTEANRQEVIRTNKLLDAFRDGQLLDEERKDWMPAAAAEHQTKELANIQRLKRESRRLVELVNLARPAPPALGAKMFVEATVTEYASQLDRVRRNGWVVVDDRGAASHIVAVDVNKLSSVSAFFAYLLGQTIVTLRFLEDASGPIIEYEEAVRFKRVIYIGEHFSTKQPALLSALSAACRAAGSRWSIAPSRAVFVGRAKPAKTQATYYAFLASKDDKTNIPKKCVKTASDAASLPLKCKRTIHK